MVILRYFRFICISGVVIGTISFVLGTLAIGTGSWLFSQELRLVRVDTNPVTSTTPEVGNVTGVNGSTTVNGTTEFMSTVDATTPVAGVQSTGMMATTLAAGPSSTPEPGIITVVATSGLWLLCQAELINDVPSEWECLNIIMNLASMPNGEELPALTGNISSRTMSPDGNLTMAIRTTEVYFQSMLAFELISVAATLAGCCIAGVAIFKQQPLAVLVAAFTMFFAGMFMLVGHSMMLSIHKSKNDDNSGGTSNSWHYGWSFITAWIAFCLCIISGIINCIVYRNFRKMSEELTGTPSRVKYANRPPPPVSLASSI